MPIVAKCACGNRMGVADALAGRTVRCAKCGGDVLVPARAAGGPVAVGRAARVAPAGPAVSISPGILVAAGVGAVLLVVVLALYLGPWRVGSDWAAMAPRANGDVTDTILFAIQAYESEYGLFDASQSHAVPQLQGSASFVPPMMAFTMPRRIPFVGKTNQGNYIGTYDTATGEVAATIEVGGTTIGGLVDVRRATGSFHMTGRVKDGQVQAEADGQPLKLVLPKFHRRFE